MEDTDTFLKNAGHVYKSGDHWTDLEAFELYRKGGWHPIELGDKLNDDRYTVLHKLGFGGYSIVWLAFDEKLRRSVAIKISAADCVSTPQEAALLRRLQPAREMLWQQHRLNIIPKLHDFFQLNGPNGQHSCLVSDPLRCNIFDTQEASGDGCSEIRVARCIAAQVVLTLKTMHKVGIAHGDVHPGNIMLQHQEAIHWTKAKLFERHGPPCMHTLQRIDGKPLGKEAPSALVVPLGRAKGASDLTLEDSAICLIDFGESWTVGTTTKSALNSPPQWCAPEGLLDSEAIGLPSDVWSLGCTLFDIMGVRPLFDAHDMDDAIFDQINTLGLLPQEWWKRWPGRHEFFGQDSQLHPLPDDDGFTPESMPLRWRVQKFVVKARQEFSGMSSEEANAFTEMLEIMLVFDPQKRATIDEVVQCHWMKKWALPQLEALTKGEVDMSKRTQETRRQAIASWSHLWNYLFGWTIWWT